MHNAQQTPARINRRTLLGYAAAATATFASGLGLAGMPSTARASQPLRLVLPLSAGSGVDAIARAAVPVLGQTLNRAVVVDNQPGAGGVIGTQTIVRAAPDGSTLGFVSNNHVIFPSVVKGLGFDPVADVTPISIICASPMLLVVRPDFPANNLRELEALLKADPQKYHYGSGGNGTILHLGAEQFLQASGCKSTHVPYKGSGPLITAVMGQQVDWAVLALPAISGHIASGSLKALGCLSPQRLKSLPDLPTAVEQGYADCVVDGWVAVLGPKGLKDDVVATMYKALQTAYTNPAVVEAMDKQGNIVTLMPPAESAAYLASERTRYAALAKAAGLEPQ